MSDLSEDLVTSLFLLIADQSGYQPSIVDRNTIICTAGEAEFVAFLNSLRTRLDNEPTEQWPAHIADYFSTLAMAAEASAAGEALENVGFEVIRSRFRSQIMPKVAALPGTVYRDIARGIVQLVMLHDVTIASPVDRSDLSGWPISESELFDLAEANGRANGFPDIDWRVYNGAAIAIMTGPTGILSDYVRWLGDYPVVDERLGALFAIPQEGSIYVHPVSPTSVTAGMLILGKAAANIHRTAAHAISPSVYRWQNGRITLAADTTIDGAENVLVEPLHEFRNELRELAPWTWA
ncbi:hypothetical protein [Nocardia sp. NPDC057030]|uniref:hypothetical protein n=1 Tax=unclassified Nocardia TaxID=2637762 RepID=UPI003630B957